jgi:hypothetical protein
MKSTYSRVLVAILLLAPTAALAHPGDHTAMSIAQVAHHIASSPDHVAELIMAGLMVVGLVIRQRRHAR